MTPSLFNSRWFCRGSAAVVLAAFVFGQPLDAGTPAESRPMVAPAAAGDDYLPPEDPKELLKIDDAMRQYFAPRIPRRRSSYERITAIVDAIIRPDGLDFVYDAEGTFDPRETFRRRRGNCASYAFLIVAVARAFGLDASFQNIKRPTRWEKVGDIVIALQHLNVRIDTLGNAYVIDLDPDIVPPRDWDAMQVISDETACAQFYCNIGFQYVLTRQMDASLRYTILATAIDPSCSSAWGNRGTLHARMGDLPAAKASFERALRADPHGEATLDGFIHVLRRLGSPEDLRQAEKLERRARSVRDRNPYYQLYLANQAQRRGDPVTAEKLLRRAISLKKDEPEFYEEWVGVLEQLGHAHAARRAAGKLELLRERLADAPVHLSR